jgi:hypothetical protein
MRTEPRRRTAPQLFTVVELQELGFSHGFSDYLSQSINYHGLSDSPQEECTMHMVQCYSVCVPPQTAPVVRFARSETFQYESRSCVQHVQYLAS